MAKRIVNELVKPGDPMFSRGLSLSFGHNSWLQDETSPEPEAGLSPEEQKIRDHMTVAIEEAVHNKPK
jgi:hypothetical protein